MTERSPIQKVTHRLIDESLNPIVGPLSRFLLQEKSLPVFKSMVDVDFPQSHQKKLALYLDEGYKIFSLSNHRSHADGLITSFVTEPLSEQFNLNGYLLIVAASLRTGHQGKVMKKFFLSLEECLSHHSLRTVDMIRAADKDLGVQGSNFEHLKQVLAAPAENIGVHMFPEGRLHGGRKKVDTNSNRFTNGMIAPDKETQKLVQKISTADNMVILPMGILGTEKIFSPSGLFITKFFMQEFIKRQNPNHQLQPFTRVTIGEPFAVDELESQGVNVNNPQELTEHYMGQIARLLPPEIQGQYVFSYAAYSKAV